MGLFAFKLRKMFQESYGIQNIMARIYMLELKERRQCMLHREKTQRNNYFNSYENPLGKQYFSLNMFLLFLSPSGTNYYFFFLFNKYTYIIYTYELHLKLFNKITTLKKPHTFPRESRKTDRPCSHTPEILPDTRDCPKSQNKENSRRWATCGKPLIRHFFYVC